MAVSTELVLVRHGQAWISHGHARELGIRGPWSGVDPFEPAKSEELAQIGELERPTDRQAILLASLWGNRADLGFRAGTPARIGPERGDRSPFHGDDVGLGQGHAAPSHEALVADDSARIWEHLAAGDPGQVIVVADNAGRELLADLHPSAPGRRRNFLAHRRNPRPDPTPTLKPAGPTRLRRHSLSRYVGARP